MVLPVVFIVVCVVLIVIVGEGFFSVGKAVVSISDKLDKLPNSQEDK